ncbi:lytic murein transglycosylase [Alicyclobacillus fodiniaquatilis]|uniref:Lytic murein transglycosylase n=1 Tax=Alicyclobacillus fodiniaquatilis TaxID=1661150 RepID=A0ABW4JFL8_9BACL
MKRPVRLILGWGLATLGVWGLVIVLLLFLLIIMMLGVVISSRDNALPASPTATVEPIPVQLLPIYHRAGARYYVPWAVLAAINRVETNFGQDMAVSSAGAIGFMQFEPATWAQYGVDADGDGKADPYDPVDAIFSAANYLSAVGIARNPEQAVFQYNHSETYVQEVLQLAETYQTWNPLSSDWVWPVTDAKVSFSEKEDSADEPILVSIHSPRGTSVRAIHAGTVTAVTNTSVTLDLDDGLIVIEQGLRPSVTTGQTIHAGETLGMANGHRVQITIDERNTPLPVLWFVSPSPPKLIPTPPLVLTSPPATSPAK